jgi:hypothetical protein
VILQALQQCLGNGGHSPSLGDMRHDENRMPS